MLNPQKRPPTHFHKSLDPPRPMPAWRLTRKALHPEADHSASAMLNAQQFRCFIEQFRDGIVLADKMGSIIEWNQAEEQITGLTRAEVLGRSIWDVDFQVIITIDERDKKTILEEKKAIYLNLIKKGKSPSLDKLVEIEIQRPDGARCHIQRLLSIIKTATGFILASIMRDITRMNQAENALLESSIRFENQKQFVSRILENIPSSLVEIDRSMRIVTVNRNFLEKTRRTEQATLGCKLDSVFPKELLVYTHLIHRVKEVFQADLLDEGGKVAFHAPGLSNRVYYIRLFPVFLIPRHPSSKTVNAEYVKNVMLLMDDITEREKLGEEIRSVERHLDSVVECADDLMVSLDPKGNIITWNRAAEVVSGIKSEQAKGKPLVSICASYQHLIMTKMLDRLTQSRSVQRIETNLITANRKEVPISWNCSLMCDDNNSVTGILAIGRDLTELRHMENKLLQSDKMASLGFLAGGIAHDLRNPLGIISSCAQLILENPKDSKLRKQGLQKIYTSTRRASLIIENLLMFARPTGGWMEKEINLHTIIHETLELLNNQITLQNVIVSETYQPDLPVYIPYLYGSKEMLQQVFANLISNACNAMPEGGLLKITAEAISTGQVEIRFMDSGCGISHENLNKIFDPFFTTMPVGKGIGMGLSISHAIVLQHRGVIEVQSEVGKGSNFIVKLPIYRKTL